MNLCIAVLTRGYSDIISYSKLIKRNKHISNNLEDKSIDILIFHEGNITDEHQIYIYNETPELKIKFINISNISFKNEKINILFEEAPNFPIGYRHMCNFWFIDFWNAVKEYDKLVRIDEDCYIDFNIDKIFLKLDACFCIAGVTSIDYDFVTKGLNDFTISFINKYNHIFTFKKSDTKGPDGPFTNIFGLSLNKIRENEILKKYIIDVDESNMIYKRRWGDLPLWGEVIYYILGSEELLIDKDIKYFHESHNSYVN
jgi:hypothetical protein